MYIHFWLKNLHRSMHRLDSWILNLGFWWDSLLLSLPVACQNQALKFAICIWKEIVGVRIYLVDSSIWWIHRFSWFIDLVDSSTQFFFNLRGPRHYPHTDVTYLCSEPGLGTRSLSGHCFALFTLRTPDPLRLTHLTPRFTPNVINAPLGIGTALFLPSPIFCLPST